MSFFLCDGLGDPVSLLLIKAKTDQCLPVPGSHSWNWGKVKALVFSHKHCSPQKPTQAHPSSGSLLATMAVILALWDVWAGSWGKG